ncbi:hypothetical protein BJX66DRAFT_318566 [Aspergillus keveii]|uniref:C2H2-type domain-containing protein n=1 Tax=Aspergillus keveii TaxID=714993 RepID=A0ABR4FK11_9EURO
MQHPIRPSQWLPAHVESQDLTHTYGAGHSLRPSAGQQLPPAPVSQHVPIFPNQDTELHSGYTLDTDDVNGAAVWINVIATEPNASETVLAQPSTCADSISDRSPGSSTDQRDPFPTEVLSSYHLGDPLELPLQELEGLRQAWVSYLPPDGQSLIHPSIEESPHTERTLRCGWRGCRSPTVFRRESDLIRHLKTVHISPKAYPCTKPGCDMAFGRRDHLKSHQITRHG